MNMTEACDILTALAKDHGEDVLATVIYMSENLGDFSETEVAAYRKFIAVGQEFFADVEEV